MYPYKVILGMNLYDIFLAIGAISALVIARIFADKDKITAKLFNFILLTGSSAIGLGYFSAVFTQAIYNWLDGEPFEINNSTGATFLGGLVGGVLTFLVIYFIVGRFLFSNKDNIKYFPRLLDFASVAITCAHGFGRLGCLMAGCCHGRVTDAWYGIYHINLDATVVPVQLFESLFLFALCAILAVLAIKKIPGTMAIYMFTYGVWRIFAETLRDDYRGSTFVDFLTPSQLTSIVLIVLSVPVFLFTLYIHKKNKSAKESGSEE